MYGCCEIEIWAGAEHAVSKDVVRPIKRDLHARDGLPHQSDSARRAGRRAILRGCGGGGGVRAGGLLGQAVAAEADQDRGDAYRKALRSTCLPFSVGAHRSIGR